jgi:hypothetical protein
MLVTCQVVAGRPAFMGGWPWSSASTDLELGIPLYRFLESVTMKPTREWLQGGAGRPGGLSGGLCTLPPHVRYALGVTIILVDFQMSL